MSVWSYRMERPTRHQEVDSVPLDFNDLDHKKDALMGKRPGWQVWYVPRAVGGINWHARPLPALSAPSPEDLDKDIGASEEEWKREGVRSG